MDCPFHEDCQEPCPIEARVIEEIKATPTPLTHLQRVHKDREAWKAWFGVDWRAPFKPDIRHRMTYFERA